LANKRPNGLPFSCRKRAAQDVIKKASISREAVSWNGVFGSSYR
jgi:hypothetical protein